LTEEATVPPWGVVSSDDFRAKQRKNATVGCGLEPAVVEDCLDGVERSVIEAVDHCSVREVGRSRFRGVIECLLGLLEFS
jgi:hypothetical protein